MSKLKRLSDGEKMIYAADYVAEYRRLTASVPREISRRQSTEHREDHRYRMSEWQLGRAAMAAEYAAAMIVTFRDIGPKLDDSFGDRHLVTEFRNDMVGEEG